MTGSYYILEDLDAEWPTSSGNGKMLITGSHGVLRHCDLRGDGASKGIGGVIVYGTYLVVWDTKIHDSGDVNARTDDDTHGISVPEKTSYLWVLDSELYRNGGDGIQINAGSLREQASTHHIYVGRNKAYRNKQTGFWVKQAVGRDLFGERGLRPPPERLLLGTVHGDAVRARAGVVPLQPPPRLRVRDLPRQQQRHGERARQLLHRQPDPRHPRAGRL